MLTDSHTLEAVQFACESGDLGAILRLVKPMAALPKPSLASAMRFIRARWDASECSPQLLCRAIRGERERLLRSERAKYFSVKADSNFGKVLCSTKNTLMAKFGKRGGMVRCPKGFATMSEDTRAKVRAAAAEGRQRAKAQREADRALVAARVEAGAIGGG